MERILEEAGERWRASQRAVPDIDPAMFAPARSRWGRPSLFAAAALGTALVLIVAVAATRLGGQPGIGAQPPVVPSVQPDPSDAAPRPSATTGQPCDVTRPVPAFVPPPPFLASPPSTYDAAWFGSAGLWTMLSRDGEVWSGLPRDDHGLSQKTFWWSADWPPTDEPAPAITVVGTRLDGPGTFTAGPGTNASADFGTAMLVGVEFPTVGCWQLAASYRDAVLSYVVSVRED